MEGIGLVLAGGGARGAYQIGVWQALKEAGLDQNITAVSGASVGALNAALFMHGDYDLAENIWLNISLFDMISVSPENIIKLVSIMGIGSMFPAAHILRISAFLSLDLSFSRDGLIKIIDKRLNLNNVRNSKVLGYASASRLPIKKILPTTRFSKPLETCYFPLNECSDKRLKSILLASSALRVFPAELIDGQRFVDGVYGGHDTPVKPLYDLGYKQLIVVHLDKESKIDHSLYPNSKIYEVRPLSNIEFGFMKGRFDFSRNNTNRRIRVGYRDAINQLNLAPYLKNNPFYEESIEKAKILMNIIKHPMRDH